MKQRMGRVLLASMMVTTSIGGLSASASFAESEPTTSGAEVTVPTAPLAAEVESPSPWLSNRTPAVAGSDPGALVQPLGEADLAIVEVDGAIAAGSGTSTSEVIVTATNLGPDPARNVVIAPYLSDAALVDLIGDGIECDSALGICRSSEFASNATATVTMTILSPALCSAEPDPAANVSIQSTSLTDEQGNTIDGTPDPNFENNSADIVCTGPAPGDGAADLDAVAAGGSVGSDSEAKQVQPVGEADLAIVEVDGAIAAGSGTSTEVIVTATNLGPDPARNVLISAYLADAALLDLIGDGIECDAALGYCSSSEFAPNATATVTMTILNPDFCSAESDFSASVSIGSSDRIDEQGNAIDSTPDPNFDNNSADIVCTGPALGDGEADLVAVAAAGSVRSGTEANQVRLVVRNDGPDPAYEPQLHYLNSVSVQAEQFDELNGLPEGWFCDSSSPPDEQGNPDGGEGTEVRCSTFGGSLEPGEIVDFTIELDATASPAVPACDFGVLTVSSETVDPNPDNNTVTGVAQGLGTCDDVGGVAGGGVADTPFQPPLANISPESTSPSPASTSPSPASTPRIATEAPRSNAPRSNAPRSNANPAARSQRNDLAQTGPRSIGLLTGFGLTMLISGAGVLAVARRKGQLPRSA